MVRDDREHDLPRLAGDYELGRFVPGPSVVIRGVIGRGGQGTVYEGEMAIRDPEGRVVPIGKKVAVKVIHIHLAGDARMISGMIAEACTLGSLSHPHIVEILNAGFTQDDRGLAFIVMELLDGISGRRLLEEKGRLPLPNVLDVAVGLASGLAAAHKKGIVHQDIKPENIFVHVDETGKPFPKLFDWGIRQLTAGGADADSGGASMVTSPSGPPVDARSTVPGRADQIARGSKDNEEHEVSGRYQGTPPYSAPEQFQGKPATPRTDVYAFGVTLFELFTGFRPFHRLEQLDKKVKGGLGENWQHSNQNLIRAKLNEEAPKLSKSIPVPPELEDLVARCLARDPSERPADASELERELAGIQRTLHPYFVKGGPTTQDILLEVVRAAKVDSSSSQRSAAAFTPALVEVPAPVEERLAVEPPAAPVAPRERRPAFAQRVPESRAPELGVAIPQRSPEPWAGASSGAGANKGEQPSSAVERPKSTLEGGVTPLARPTTPKGRTAAIFALAVLGVALPVSVYALLKAAPSAPAAVAPAALQTSARESAPSSVPASSAEVAPPSAAPLALPRPAETVAMPTLTPESPDAASSASESPSSELAVPARGGSRSSSPTPHGTTAPPRPHASAPPPAASSKNDALYKLLHK
jgi:serine/threonine protein kinase